jgi:mRNA interferase MazF
VKKSPKTVTLQRGDVCWASLDPTVGAEIQKTRPVVVLSVNPLNRVRRTVVVVPLSTSAPAVEPINIALKGGSVARCDQIRTLDKSRLTQKIGTISLQDLTAIENGIKQVLGFL